MLSEVSDTNSPLNRCGPHKLAKAFMFCLSNTSNSSMNCGSQLSPLRALATGLASLQSLLKVSPDSSFHPVEVPSQSEYFTISPGFPSGNPSGASESSVLALDTNKATKRKPLLLLVEDNDINLKVCLDHERFEISLLYHCQYQD
jgi:hypothetical protein